MTIDKAQLKALAEAATQSHGARRVEVDHNGVHVIGDGSWKILSAWHTPDGKGAQNAEFAAVASPATVLALLAEIERLKADNCSLRGSCAKTGSENAGLSRQLKKATRQSADARAELAGLRTGYEAQNNVIAGLRAESEELEKAAMSYGEDLQWHMYELERVKAERNALIQDANRYRELRDNGYLDSWADVHICDEHRRPGLIDSSIDAAMWPDGVPTNG